MLLKGQLVRDGSRLLLAIQLSDSIQQFLRRAVSPGSEVGVMINISSWLTFHATCRQPPPGDSTENIPRPQIGSIPYGMSELPFSPREQDDRTTYT